MAIIDIINVSTPNDNLGDSLRLSQVKANSNFAKLNAKKVEIVAGFDLSQNNFTDAEKKKLADLNPLAGVQVQSNWAQDNNTSPDFILNKPPSLISSIGSFHYADLGSQTTPQAISANVAEKIINDANGAYTSSANAPYGISNVYNSTTNHFNFSALSVGDQVNFRIDTILETSGANQLYNFYLKFAIGSPDEFTLNVAHGQVKTSGTFRITQDISFDIGYENIKNYPAELWILTDNNANLRINGYYFAILQKNVNIVTISAPVIQEYTGLFSYTNGVQTFIVPSNVKIMSVTLNDGRPLKIMTEWKRTSPTEITILYTLELNDTIYITGFL